MNQLLYALVGPHPGPSKTIHMGVRPPTTADGEIQVHIMPIARVLVIDESEPDSVLLYRFAADGSIAGDTWHQSVEEAKRAANSEYYGDVSEWLPVPVSDTNLAEFVRAQSQA